MLLLDDNAELPSAPTDDEIAFLTRIGEAEQEAIHARLVAHCGERWLKVARVVSDALDDGGYSPWEDWELNAHVRLVICLVNEGVLEAQGDLLRPRRSEVRLAGRT